MNVLNKTANELSHIILHASWQAALIAGFVFVLLILTRRIMSSQLRYALLLVVLVKFVTPPFLDLPTGVISHYSPIRSTVVSSETIYLVDSATTNASATSQHSNHTENKFPLVAVKPDITITEPGSNRSTMLEVSKPKTEFPWSTLLMSIYLFGTAVFVALLIHRYRLVRQIMRESDIQSDGVLWSELKRISKQLKMKSLPELRISDKTDAPFAMGAFRPVIVMPRLIAEELQPDQLTIVMAHELAHIHRRDLLIGWFETLVNILWWFHPAMWWLRKSLRETREDCCDDILLANQLANPDRYCETLIDAASRQSTKLAEPLVLGFVHREHPIARRIRRLMDGSLFRADRLRFPAIILTLLLALIMLPGMRPERQSVTKTTLEGLFGWTNLSFQIDASEEATINECRKIAQTYFSMSSYKRIFSQLETRVRLEAILDEHPKCFYAQYLLGTWYRLNGDLELSTQLLNESLANAPVVLSQRYRLGNGKPIRGVEISEIEIECNRVQNHSLDPSLNLKFVGLITDSKGMVHLPVYDTVYRISTQSYPEGYYAEFKNLGWFKSNSLNGELPDVMVWRPWSQPRNFTGTAAESKWLNNARGTDTRELTSGPNSYKLGGIARSQADGTFTIENGKGKSLPSLQTELPDIKNAKFMDHALVNLSEPAPSRFEIAEVQFLDSQTKIPLQSFQSGAGFTWTDKSNIHLFSIWDTLPNIVDLVLKVYNYDENIFRYKIQPKVGATAQHAGASFKITHLTAGNHSGWSSRDGFYGEAQSLSSTSEMIVDITGSKQSRFSLWVVSKDGRRQNLKEGWFSISVGSSPIRIMMPLHEIDHFELLPYVKPVSIYFEKIQLPARKTPLEQQLPVIEFPIGGTARNMTSDLFSPLLVNFESQRGNVFSGCGSRMRGFELRERPEEERSPETKSTVMWNYWANIKMNHQLDFTFKSGTAKKGGRSSYNCSGAWGVVNVASLNKPLESIDTVRLQFLPKTADD
ncbi:M56 family metallopeptidase [Gimesia aquarii]|uniref:Regulatory protein BlaR1 n=1 Tax=Gimesia aquarii TaxID=2527964 RepID=A0A517X0M0_9PLAN|nr:M56 family metallopeptidase [Gimesia aquarii]QDU11053.1 Regulatory protein BlaR1 [Gimesia aquarii]